jgi:hypothetical protein
MPHLKSYLIKIVDIIRQYIIPPDNLLIMPKPALNLARYSRLDTVFRERYRSTIVKGLLTFDETSNPAFSE